MVNPNDDWESSREKNADAGATMRGCAPSGITGSCCSFIYFIPLCVMMSFDNAAILNLVIAEEKAPSRKTPKRTHLTVAFFGTVASPPIDLLFDRRYNK